MVRFYHFYGELVRIKLQRCLIGKAIKKTQQTILFILPIQSPFIHFLLLIYSRNKT